MKKQNLILLALFVLLTCNCFLLWRLYHPSSFLIEKAIPPFERPQRGEGPRMFIIEQLHFDKEQTIRYEELIQEHRSSIRAINRETLSLKRTLYASLLVPTNQDSIIHLISMQQEKVEQVNLLHFASIQKLCRPDQLKYFEGLVAQLGELFSEAHPPERIE